MPEWAAPDPVMMWYPESFGREFGPNGAGHDAQAIQAAVAASQAYAGPTAAGTIVLSQQYVLEAPVVVPPGPPVHFWFANGAMNRQVNPPTFTGASLQPANGYAGSALLTIGSAGNPNTNPNGTMLINPTLNGASPNGTLVANLIGLLINDTSDVILDRQ